MLLSTSEHAYLACGSFAAVQNRMAKSRERIYRTTPVTSGGIFVDALGGVSRNLILSIGLWRHGLKLEKHFRCNDKAMAFIPQLVAYRRLLERSASPACQDETSLVRDEIFRRSFGVQIRCKVLFCFIGDPLLSGLYVDSGSGGAGVAQDVLGDHKRHIPFYS